jgi:hypothetical protein
LASFAGAVRLFDLPLGPYLKFEISDLVNRRGESFGPRRDRRGPWSCHRNSLNSQRHDFQKIPDFAGVIESTVETERKLASKQLNLIDFQLDGTAP